MARSARVYATPFDDPLFERVCSGCGCTDGDCSQCIEKTGESCFWVEPDLCSACDESDRAAAFAAALRRPVRGRRVA